MSNTEHKVGRQIPIEVRNTLEEKAKNIVESKVDKLEEYHNNYIDALNDYCYKEYIVLDKKIYKVEMEEFNDGEDIYEAKLNSDNSISFVVKYYNGGVSFEEAIEYSLKKMEEKTIVKNNIKYKFRAKQLDDEQWVEGDKIECSGKTWIVINATLGAKLGEDLIHCEVVEVNKNTLEIINYG